MTTMLLATVLLVATLVTTAAEAASFSIPGCAPGTFAIIARTKVGFEQGPTDLQGNVLVTKSDGFAQIGAHNKIRGTVIADKIFLGTGAVVDNCVADEITGPGVCTTVSGTYSGAPAACKVFDFVIPPVDPCVNTALLVNVPAGQSETLAPGCYGLVRVGLGAELILEPGVFLMKELRLLTGASLEGATGAVRSRVLVKGGVVFSTASHLSHLDILTSSTVGDAVTFGSSNVLDDVQAIVAGAGLHLHSKFTADNSGIAAVNVVVEPGVFKTNDTPPICKCPPGFVLPPVGQACVPE